MSIIDFHTHVMPPELIKQREELCLREPWFARLYAGPKARLTDADGLVIHMREVGVHASVVFGFPFQDVGLCRACNDYVLDAARRYPKELLPFGVTNPRIPAGIAEAERVLQADAVGLGELIPDGQGYALNDARVMRPVMELAHERRVPVMLHVTEPVGHGYAGKGWQGPREAYEMVCRHPGNDIVLSHWGGGLLFYEHMPEVKRACVNVYYDTAASPLLYDNALYADALRWMPGKILFGSDYPLLSPQRYLSTIPADEQSGREGLLGGNAARLLGLHDAGG